MYLCVFSVLHVNSCTNLFVCDVLYMFVWVCVLNFLVCNVLCICVYCSGGRCAEYFWCVMFYVSVCIVAGAVVDDGGKRPESQCEGFADDDSEDEVLEVPCLNIHFR